MKNDIFPYNDLVQKEGINLQRGMNYRPRGKYYSIFLMSVRANAPYNDGFDKEGKRLFYEGEDVTKKENAFPKKFDQAFFTKTGKLTNNGIFFKLAEDYRLGRKSGPEKIHVYEKLSSNIWSDIGLFDLVNAKYVHIKKEGRKVFRFVLEPISLRTSETKEEYEDFEFSRRIPTEIKRLVWDRDNGKCRICGSTKDLHFDHLIPFSKGGSSRDPKNIQLLCGKHNLEKSNKIL